MSMPSCFIKVAYHAYWGFCLHLVEAGWQREGAWNSRWQTRLSLACSTKCKTLLYTVMLTCHLFHPCQVHTLFYWSDYIKVLHPTCLYMHEYFHTLKTHLCDYGWSSLIKVDQHWSTVNHTCSNSWSWQIIRLFPNCFLPARDHLKLSQNINSSLIIWDESDHLSSHDQVGFWHKNLINVE